MENNAPLIHTWHREEAPVKDPTGELALDKLDFAVAGGAGLLAALVDVILVGLPRHGGFLGGKPSPGGSLSNAIRDGINQHFPKWHVRALERRGKVIFDAATSRGLDDVVKGMSPGTHRFQSLGHDPVLGWVFGVLDSLRGTLTAVGADGRLITQKVIPSDPSLLGLSLFEAVERQFFHLLSDVSTSRGLPAPLMPLLQLVQVGSFGEKGYTVGELSRIMYREGYDFRHFLSMSVPTMLVEVLIRSGYFLRALSEGKPLADAVPLILPGQRGKRRLRRMLLVGHALASAGNAGKVAWTKNPLAVNYPQWVALARYATPEVKEWAAQVFETQQKKARERACLRIKIAQDLPATPRRLILPEVI